MRTCPSDALILDKAAAGRLRSLLLEWGCIQQPEVNCMASSLLEIVDLGEGKLSCKGRMMTPSRW